MKPARALTIHHETLGVVDGIYRQVETSEPMVRWILPQLDDDEKAVCPATGRDIFRAWCAACLTAPAGYTLTCTDTGYEITSPTGSAHYQTWPDWVPIFQRRYYGDRHDFLDELYEYLDFIGAAEAAPRATAVRS